MSATPVADRVMIIEDEPEIRDLIGYHLERSGFQVTAVGDGQEGLRRIFESPPDALVLDLMLPGVHGIEILREIRDEAATADLPVIVVTARTSEMDTLLGFENGADDYVTKPLSPRELVARVQALLRRSRVGPGRRTIDAGPVRIDTAAREAWCRERRLMLTPREFGLLTYLARRAGKVVSRDELLHRVWDRDVMAGTRTVDVHIRRLRSKLGADAGVIETAMGAGYKIAARAEPETPASNA
ncbi:MAG: response regulator transcription factor [Candidatus Eisenbacteria bacterium]|uniref:Response regulator transcription factor n=1 Tax=Eiseniibacteriota bacterium TaxID=2212470 RepID=A0A9D6L7Q5_UNCEI|nr:response regulator transcription factor [Candidatus Eisenbacteria bacterium]